MLLTTTIASGYGDNDNNSYNARRTEDSYGRRDEGM